MTDAQREKIREIANKVRWNEPNRLRPHDFHETKDWAWRELMKLAEEPS